MISVPFSCIHIPIHYALLCYREDLEDRLKLKKKLEQEDRSLIQRKTEEQWKRHAYRLAHPAYADGRIW